MLGYKWISTKMVGSGGLDNVINVHRFSLKYYYERSACVAFGRCRGNVVSAINSVFFCSSFSAWVTFLPEWIVLGF